jgi:hypothetical protein
MLVLYPMVSLGNAVLGSLVSASMVNLIVCVFALGGAYPVVAGDWSPGRIGEYIFVLIASVITWGLIGMVIVLTSGVSISGSNIVPQAMVWVAAYLTAYFVVYRTQVSVCS